MHRVVAYIIIGIVVFSILWLAWLIGEALIGNNEKAGQANRYYKIFFSILIGSIALFFIYKLSITMGCNRYRYLD